MGMQIRVKIKENWFSRKGNKDAPFVAAAFALLLLGLSLVAFQESHFSWMAASKRAIWESHEAWRLWSSLFVHGDFGHIAANAALFIPLTYLLSSHFGPLLFPLLGIAMGGLINLIVLSTMPPDVSLIGISGVVSWMAAAWVTLFLLIDRRDKLKRRFGAALFLTLILFVPETAKPEVSYFSHFVGYVLGMASGAIYYGLHRKTIEDAEVKEITVEEDLIEEEEWRA